MRTILIALFSFLLVNGFAQSGQQNVCKVNLEEKPYFISPELDTLTVPQLTASPVLHTRQHGFAIVSFQLSVNQTALEKGAVKMFVMGCNILQSGWAKLTLKHLKPGDILFLECIQAKNADGEVYVLQNRQYVIK